MDLRAVGLALILAVSIGVTPSLTHTGATGVTKERMDAMVDMGRTLKQLRQHMREGDLMVAVGVPALIEQLSLEAQSIVHKFMVRDLPDISEASPAIWDDAEGFKQITELFNTDMEVLLKAYESGDEATTIAALRKVSISCNDCHDEYRISK